MEEIFPLYIIYFSFLITKGTKFQLQGLSKNVIKIAHLNFDIINPAIHGNC